MKTVNPEMLVLGREMRGLTQKQLADATGIDQGLISRYENEVRDIAPKDLERISSVLELPETFFFRNGHIYGPEISSIYHRKRQAVPASRLKAIYARINEVRLNVQRLLDSVELETPYEFPRYDPAEYGYDFELIAQQVRVAWKLPTGPIQNVTEVIENAGGVIFRESLNTRQVDAVVQWLPPLPPIILVNEDVPGDRVRFTLAHEIGHLVMHPSPTKDMEAEADAFAAAFLMPKRDISKDLEPVTLEHLAQLKPKWKVSIQALMHRALDLNKISPRRYRSLIMQFNKMGYRTNEPLPIAQEHPTLLQELIEVFKTEYNYSISELAHMLTLHEWEFRRLYLRDRQAFHVVPRKQWIASTGTDLS